uniref:Protein MON2 homolog n=1 Tax=Kalanchoe fedtschenkoi TaxID=63787 RepID=A0A7N0ZU03_KALFE
MAFMAVLESDLRALSAEARRRYPAIKDGAEHAILKLRSLSSPSDIAHNDDILRIFLVACEVRSVKLSVIGLSCLQNLISHDAVAPSALKEILATLKDHAEMNDEIVQLKTLQTILIIFQSRLHPENEDNMARALGICLHLLEYNRSSDSVRNTAAATFRQAVALIFDHVVSAESLPISKFGSGGFNARSSSVSGDVNRSISISESLEHDVSGGSSSMREVVSKSGKLGLRVLEDLTALAAGGSATWLRVNSIQRTFALDILEFILSNYVVVFKTLISYEQVLRYQICSLIMTSLRTNVEHENEAGEPSFRRLVLRAVAHIIRLYSTTLTTECEVFLSMLVKVTTLDLPLWHRILVLEILRGFCVEAWTLRILFQNFDMNPKNTNVVEGMVKALARVVSSVQVQESSDESLAAVAGMFSSKAKGVEWILDNEASNAAVLVASEAHAITLAVEGLLGVIFTVATLTDEAIDVGELESPRGDSDVPAKHTGKTVLLCLSMVDTTWLTILDALSLILARSQGEAIVLEILKGYQAFTQACGVLRAVEPLNSFLASLCKFTISIPNEAERKSHSLSPGPKRSEALLDQKESIVLTPKNVQALRTLFNVAHRLHNVLGPSWVLVLETLAALDRAIHSPHATTQEVSNSVPKLTRESSGQYSDFHILSSLNSQLFESSALMHISSVKSLLSALRQLSLSSMPGASASVGPGTSQKIGNIKFSVERMISIIVNNIHRVEPLWDHVVGHFLELSNSPNHHLRNMGLEALDKSLCAVLGSKRLQNYVPYASHNTTNDMKSTCSEQRTLELSVISPLRVLYFSSENTEVRAGSLKILLHVLERYGEKLHHSWENILELLRSVANASEKDLVTLGFQSLRVIMNDGLSALPSDCLHMCVDVTGAYSAQNTELNISLTAIGLLWTATDFIGKRLLTVCPVPEPGVSDAHLSSDAENGDKDGDTYKLSKAIVDEGTKMKSAIDDDQLLFSVFLLLYRLGSDARPEVRNSAVRTLFQTLGNHGQKLSRIMWEDCLWNYVFPTLDRASHMAATSSKDEWQGKELGTRGGKAVHMLIHHSRNTAQKQWDETLVLVLGGIARLLRSFFPLLKDLKDFWSGWESLLMLVKDAISTGSKEVTLAAVNCLQTTVVSHAPKGNLPAAYLKSVLDLYELVLQNSPNYGDSSASKVKQEILHYLGETFVQAKEMFDDAMYLKLLAIVTSAIKQTKISDDNFEAEFGHVPHVQRTILEILPILRPADNCSSMWSLLLEELLHYLPKSDSQLLVEDSELEQGNKLGFLKDVKPKLSNGFDASSIAFGSPLSASKMAGVPGYLFAEKFVPVLVSLFLQAPVSAKYGAFPEIISGLGRCMTTRRENPDGGLWRVAVEGFNQILLDDVNKLNLSYQPHSNHNRPRIRIWKEVADVCEIFLVGYCGRALPSSSISGAALKSDENLEMTILNVLGDKILKSPIDAPPEILKRIIGTLDQCASRTCSLPIETVELMPGHCGRFSLTCLQKLFSLSSYDQELDDWHSTRSEVSKISIALLMTRCRYILHKFLTDENDLGDRPLPSARIEEILYVLKELALLLIHRDTARALPLPSFLKSSAADEADMGTRPHLLYLYPSFCELVVSRESRVRELVQVLLRLIGLELRLEKESHGQVT